MSTSRNLCTQDATDTAVYPASRDAWADEVAENVNSATAGGREQQPRQQQHQQQEDGNPIARAMTSWWGHLSPAARTAASLEAKQWAAAPPPSPRPLAAAEGLPPGVRGWSSEGYTGYAGWYASRDAPSGEELQRRLQQAEGTSAGAEASPLPRHATALDAKQWADVRRARSPSPSD